jgi:hypothetical protein
MKSWGSKDIRGISLATEPLSDRRIGRNSAEERERWLLHNGEKYATLFVKKIDTLSFSFPHGNRHAVGLHSPRSLCIRSMECPSRKEIAGERQYMLVIRSWGDRYVRTVER